MAGEGDDLDALYGDVAGDGKGDPARAEGDPTSAAGEAPSANLDEVYQTYEPSKVGAQVGAAPQKHEPAAANRTGTGGGGGSVAVYVANLQWWTTDAEVESACAEFGRVAGLKFFEEKSNGKSKGYALVTFVDSADADACLQGLNGREINGKNVLVAFQHNSNSGGQAAGGPSKGSGAPPGQRRERERERYPGSGGGSRSRRDRDRDRDRDRARDRERERDRRDRDRRDRDRDRESRRDREGYRGYRR